MFDVRILTEQGLLNNIAFYITAANSALMAEIIKFSSTGPVIRSRLNDDQQKVRNRTVKSIFEKSIADRRGGRALGRGGLFEVFKNVYTCFFR